ncbi:MAG TPA: hypothetical protein PKC39_13090 [Ferruginibacter sp.]|nr:hypothetical protein [Ferruginibacter sp.]HMP21888.1 hypothetical protein [Ferruginibacter sp.]
MSIIRATVLFILLSISTACSVTAQVIFEVPQNVQLNVKEDYPKYTADIITAAKWLEETDLDKQPEKRREVTAFAMKWVLGCPMFDVMITEQLSKIYGKNQQLLALYLISYSAKMLETNNYSDKFTATKAAVTSMMNVYKKGIDMLKTKEMGKLIKLNEEGKLDDYIKQKLM